MNITLKRFLSIFLTIYCLFQDLNAASMGPDDNVVMVPKKVIQIFYADILDARHQGGRSTNISREITVDGTRYEAHLKFLTENRRATGTQEKFIEDGPSLNEILNHHTIDEFPCSKQIAKGPSDVDHWRSYYIWDLEGHKRFPGHTRAHIIQYQCGPYEISHHAPFREKMGEPEYSFTTLFLLLLYPYGSGSIPR